MFKNSGIFTKSKNKQIITTKAFFNLSLFISLSINIYTKLIKAQPK